MENFPPQPLTGCFINNVKVTALINTGSMLSILSQSVFDTLPDKPLLRIALIPMLVFLSPVSHYSLHSRGEIFARLQFSGGTHSYHTPFLICDNVLPPLECILGWDFLLSHQLKLILKDSRYFLEGPHSKPPFRLVLKTPFRHLPPILSCLNNLFRRALFRLL